MTAALFLAAAAQNRRRRLRIAKALLPVYRALREGADSPSGSAAAAAAAEAGGLPANGRGAGGRRGAGLARRSAGVWAAVAARPGLRGARLPCWQPCTPGLGREVRHPPLDRPHPFPRSLAWPVLAGKVGLKLQG